MRNYRQAAESDLFNLDYLIERPSLKPNHSGAPILLIDELDRADEAFEAFLREILSDWQITIPEHGTIKAESPPIVIITTSDLLLSLGRLSKSVDI